MAFRTLVKGGGQPSLPPHHDQLCVCRRIKTQPHTTSCSFTAAPARHLRPSVETSILCPPKIPPHGPRDQVQPLAGSFVPASFILSALPWHEFLFRKRAQSVSGAKSFTKPATQPAGGWLRSDATTFWRCRSGTTFKLGMPSLFGSWRSHMPNPGVAIPGGELQCPLGMQPLCFLSCCFRSCRAMFERNSEMHYTFSPPRRFSLPQSLLHLV